MICQVVLDANFLHFCITLRLHIYLPISTLIIHTNSNHFSFLYILLNFFRFPKRNTLLNYFIVHLHLHPFLHSPFQKSTPTWLLSSVDNQKIYPPKLHQHATKGQKWTSYFTALKLKKPHYAFRKNKFYIIITYMFPKMSLYGKNYL